MTTNPQVPDVSKLSLEELKDLTAQDLTDSIFGPDQPNPQGDERKRDDQGRFVKEVYTRTVDPQEEEDPDPQDPEITIYRKEIDLGDGSGVQVFTGKSVDELLDKLATAQANATKKIRELNTRLKAIETAKPADPEPNPDDEFILGQKLATEPTKVIKQLVDAELARREASKKSQEEREAAVAMDFMNRNPEYYPSQNNGLRLFKFIQTYKLDPTVDNLEKAYAELTESGLLEVRPATSEEPGVPEDPDTDTDPARIERAVERPSPPEPAPRKKAASGLSSRGALARPVKSAELTEEEVNKLPTDKLRELASRELRKLF
jgi:hypothetical protein